MHFRRVPPTGKWLRPTRKIEKEEALPPIPWARSNPQAPNPMSGPAPAEWSLAAAASEGAPMAQPLLSRQQTQPAAQPPNTTNFQNAPVQPLRRSIRLVGQASTPSLIPHSGTPTSRRKTGGRRRIQRRRRLASRGRSKAAVSSSDTCSTTGTGSETSISSVGLWKSVPVTIPAAAAAAIFRFCNATPSFPAFRHCIPFSAKRQAGYAYLSDSMVKLTRCNPDHKRRSSMWKVNFTSAGTAAILWD